MSSRQLEERQEAEFIAWVASEVGLTVDELTTLDFEVDEITGNDGTAYGHTVTFDEGSDPEILAKVRGLQGDSWVQIGFPPDEPEPEDV
jgi:hypothetical protein